MKCPECEINNAVDLDCDKCDASGLIAKDNEDIECYDCGGLGYIDGWHECLGCGHQFEE